MLNMREFDLLAIIPLLAIIFSMYEIAGLTLPGFHTISYYASYNFWLKALITLLFLSGGIGGAIWFFFFHAVQGRVPR